MAPTTMTILGSSWSPETGRVRIREHDNASSEMRQLVGLTLEYEASKQRVCLGHKPFRVRGAEYVDCPMPPVPGSRRCRRCTSAEAAFAANLHHAHTRDAASLDPAIAEHLQQTNHLYLAGFADGTIKVGTSTLARTDVRLAEQGAWSARLVSLASNGFVVRELEDRVSAEIGLPQSVSVRRKVDGIVRPVSDQSLNRGLDQMTMAVHALIARMGDADLTPIEQPWSHPAKADTRWRGARIYPLQLATGKHSFSVVQACGRVIALQRPDAAGELRPDVFVADLGALYGVVLEIGSHEGPEILVQDSLF